MTAPVDPRPYAGPGDLVTAADVLAWLRRPLLDRYREHMAMGGDRLQPYIAEVDMLAFRLDRERRFPSQEGASPGRVRRPVHGD